MRALAVLLLLSGCVVVEEIGDIGEEVLGIDPPEDACDRTCLGDLPESHWETCNRQVDRCYELCDEHVGEQEDDCGDCLATQIRGPPVDDQGECTAAELDEDTDCGASCL